MKLELKSYILTNDPFISPEKWHPENEDYFSATLEMEIGVKDERGAEIFNNLLICTPAWIADHMPSDGILWGHHMLLVKEYNFRQIKRHVEKFLEAIDGKTWEELAWKITRIADWEFENYQDSK